MPDPNPAALEFLLSRRSRPHKTLGLPIPDRAALEVMLTAAARTPDHGKLEPWRFIVLERAALQRLAGMVADRAVALGKDPDTIPKAVSQFADAHLAVVVVESPKDSPKIPMIEQTYSAGAACLALLNAALAAGWGANWLTGWMVYDAEITQTGLGLAPHERVAGVIHLGLETVAPKERPRPDISAITTWMSD